MKTALHNTGMVVALGMAWLAGGAWASGPEQQATLAREDFESADYQPVVATESAELSGVFPGGSAVRLDSGWANLEAVLGPVEGTGGQGATALSVELRRVQEGALMLLIPGPITLDGTSELVLSFMVRGGGQGMTVNLRETHDPARKWKLLATRSVTTANEWSRVEARFPPTQNPLGGQIEIRFSRPGDYLIDDLQLVAIRRDPGAQRQALAGQNLLEASSQPAGKTAAWSFGPRVSSDPAEVGPTGVPAIRFEGGALSGGGQATLELAVPSEVGGTMTLSFWARQSAGEPRKLNARLYPRDANPWWVSPYAKDSVLTEQWQRFSHTVDLPSASEGFHIAQLVITGKGADVWVDGLMVEVGETMSAFVRPAAVELGLADAQPLGVHFDHQPMALSVHAWGALSELQRVRVTATDIAGQSQTTEVELPGHEAVRVAGVTLDAQRLAYGPILVEAEAMDESGVSISRVEEIVLHKVREPRGFGQPLPGSAFGVHLWPDSEEQVAAAARLGFRWVRLFDAAEWPSVEPKRGEFHWDKLDATIAEFEAYDFQVLAILGLTPDWARRNASFKSLNGYWIKKGLPERIEDYEHYVAAVAGRYAGRIDAYEPWNEPYWARFFVREVGPDGTKVRGTPQEYADLHMAAARAIRSASPEALIGWNMGGAHQLEDVMANDLAIAEAGVLDERYTDVLTIHDYNSIGSPAGYPGDAASTHFPGAARSLAERFGRPDLRVWDSESGMTPAMPSGSWYRHAAPLNRRETSLDQADQLVRLYVSRLSAGVEKWFLYSFSNLKGFQPSYDMLAPDGHLPPFGSALSQLFWQIEGLTFDRVHELDDQVQAYCFQGPQRQTVVLLPKAGIQRRVGALPDGVECYDWFGNRIPEGDALSSRPTYLTGPVSAFAEPAYERWLPRH